MRIYNGTKSLVDVPLTGRVRLTVPAHSVSKDFMPSDEFLKMIAQVYQSKDLALIVTGPYELNLCAKTPAIAPMIAYSLDEAVIRFNGPSVAEGDKEEIKEVLPEPIMPLEPMTVVEEETISEPVEEERVEEAPEEEEADVESEVKPEEEVKKTKKRNKKH